jgi:membrane fusion protein (multidrug efflux system)
MGSGAAPCNGFRTIFSGARAHLRHSRAAVQFPDPGTANFKETQLDAMRPRQLVRLAIDAYPHRDVRGHVASIQPGSGTAFSLLPAQNATRNYVKIVQRVPVKIVIDDPPDDVALGPGMSVVPSVRVNAAPSLYEQLQARI